METFAIYIQENEREQLTRLGVAKAKDMVEAIRVGRERFGGRKRCAEAIASGGAIVAYRKGTEPASAAKRVEFVKAECGTLEDPTQTMRVLAGWRRATAVVRAKEKDRLTGRTHAPAAKV